MAECFGRGQVSMADSQADSTDCQALLHPRGLRIVFLGVIFCARNPLSSSPQRAPFLLPWARMAIGGSSRAWARVPWWPGGGTRVHDGTWGRNRGPERGRKSWSELWLPQLG